MKPKQSAQSNKEWVVEQIEAWIKIDGKIHYYVNWKNYGKTWEPEENMTNCKQKLSQFYRSIHNDRYMSALFTHCNGFDGSPTKINIYDPNAKPAYIPKFEKGKGYIQTAYK